MNDLFCWCWCCPLPTFRGRWSVFVTIQPKSISRVPTEASRRRGEPCPLMRTMVSTGCSRCFSYKRPIFASLCLIHYLDKYIKKVLYFRYNYSSEIWGHYERKVTWRASRCHCRLEAAARSSNQHYSVCSSGCLVTREIEGPPQLEPEF